MQIGILSDTHNRAGAMKAAMATLRAAGAEFIIHCGDVGSEQILDQLAGVPAAFVWGNNDFERDRLRRYAENLDIGCYDDFADLELAGKQLAVVHGDDARLRQKLIHEQRHDYLLQGHTHIPSDVRVGKIRCINPGALHRAREKTVALLDTNSDRLTFLKVDEATSRPNPDQ